MLACSEGSECFDYRAVLLSNDLRSEAKRGPGAVGCDVSKQKDEDRVAATFASPSSGFRRLVPHVYLSTRNGERIMVDANLFLRLEELGPISGRLSPSVRSILNSSYSDVVKTLGSTWRAWLDDFHDY